MFLPGFKETTVHKYTVVFFKFKTIKGNKNI